MFQFHQPLIPEEDGLCCGARTPENLLRLGGALANTANTFLIGYEAEDSFPAAAANILAGAAASAGGSCTLVPDVTLPELSAASLAGDFPLLVHIAGQRLHIFAKGLLPLTAAQQEIIMQQKPPAWNPPALCGKIADGSGLGALFPAKIIERLPQPLPLLNEISTGSMPLYRLMNGLLRGGHGPMMTLQFSSDGRRLAVYTEECGWIFHEKLLLMVCQRYLEAGKAVALPYWMPRAAESLADQCGSTVLRYASCSDGSDIAARELAAKQGFTLDGTLLCAEFLRAYAEGGVSLKTWLSSLPACHTVRRIVRLGDEEKHPLERWQTAWNASQTTEGLRAEAKNGSALVRPSKSGRTVTLLTEAATMEAAAEIAGDISAFLGH